MRLAIQHETTYRYSHPVSYTIQLLRVTPRLDPHQRLLEWTIDTPGRRTRHIDAYGNITHTLIVDQPHEKLRVLARGVVELMPLSNGRLNEGRDDPRHQVLPRETFLVATPLTTADASVQAFARQAVPRGLRNTSDALVLAQAICDRVTYESGATDVNSTASQALEIGRGVCQDHAHLMVAVCRYLGVPARYVSGYIHPGDSSHVASHAWADIWFPDSGWTSIDVTHGEFTNELHCRVAVGRDYDSASPVRGVRTGGGEETMAVRVTVAHTQR
jgi:transglutaminase-like putative cysteine protease